MVRNTCLIVERQRKIVISADLYQWIGIASIVYYPVNHWDNTSKDKGRVEDQPPHVPVAREELRVSLSKETGKCQHHHHYCVE